MRKTLKSIKDKLFGDERETEIGFVPNGVRDGAIPKFRLRKKVDAQGRIYLPKDVRTVDGMQSDVTVGDKLSLDVFAPSYGGAMHERLNEREIYVDVSVASGNRITIPAEVRRELDIREGDEIAVHAYWRE